MASLSGILGAKGFQPATASPWLSHALAYAGLGWPVFPVVGKQPLPRSGGVYDGTTDSARLKNLFSPSGITGLALSCGFACAPGHHVEVVDVDPRNGGDVTLEILLACHGALPETVYQCTGGGGLHYLFAVPDGSRIKSLGKGIDIKRQGGYIVLAPSQHESGHAYDMPLDGSPFEGCPIAPAPAWLIEDAAEIVTLGLSGRGYLPPARIAELRLALDHLDHDDYHVWVKVGQALHSTEAEDAFDVWREWSQRSSKYRPGICERKWASFKAGGGLGVESIFHMAREAGAELGALKSGGTMALAMAEATAEKPSKRVSLLRLGDLGAIKPTQWIIKGYLPEESFGTLYGPSGHGKTFVVLDMALHIAAGKDWHGRTVKQSGVVYVCGEGRKGIQKRAAAWAKHHDANLSSSPFFISSRPIPMLDADFVAEFIAATVEAVRACGPIALVVIDTLNRNFGDGDENRTDDMTRFVEACSEVQRATGASVLVVHHTGLADGSRARGSGALRAALDVEMQAEQVSDNSLTRLTCTKMKDDEPFLPIAFRREVVEIEIDDDSIETSCVLIPEKDPEQANDLATNLLKNTGKKERAIHQLLTQYVTRARLNNPSITQIIIERAELITDLKTIGILQNHTSQYINRAISKMWIKNPSTSNLSTFEVLVSA